LFHPTRIGRHARYDSGRRLLLLDGARQARREKAKWKVVGPKRGFLVQGEDRTGAAAELLERLGTAKINVTAIDAASVNGRYGAMFWVAPKDVKKTAALLGAS
jgi:hypothetical protein